MRVAVLDGYTDEPSSLGVPPFLAPLPRYIFGAVLDAGHEAEYLTIDDVRREGPRWRRAAAADVLVVVAGAVVPGRYLATMPLSPREARRLASHRGTTVFAGACAAAGIAPRGGGDRLRVAELRELYDHVVPLDPDAFIHGLLIGGGTPR
ncbi:MAG TPA: radical SAM protein, partial [Thermoplasmata archaeon]|nr:radical SAM protein [Thermoplasmata archaeon]